MACGLETQKVKEIMSKFEQSANGTRVPKDVLDNMHQVIIGKIRH